MERFGVVLVVAFAAGMVCGPLYVANFQLCRFLLCAMNAPAWRATTCFLSFVSSSIHRAHRDLSRRIVTWP